MNTVYERILTLTLIEKIKKDPEYAKRLGISQNEAVNISEKGNRKLGHKSS